MLILITYNPKLNLKPETGKDITPYPTEGRRRAMHLHKELDTFLRPGMCLQ